MMFWLLIMALQTLFASTAFAQATVATTAVPEGMVAISNLWLALIVSFAAIPGPMLALLWTSRSNRKAKLAEALDRKADKEQDAELARRLLTERLAREDLVAARVAETAAKAEAAAQRAEETAQAAAATNLLNGAALDHVIKTTDVIHGLVNSERTASYKSELNLAVMLVAQTNETIEIKRKNGMEPNPDTITALDIIRARVVELRKTIAQREEQQKAMDEAAAAAVTAVTTKAIEPLVQKAGAAQPVKIVEVSSAVVEAIAAGAEKITPPKKQD